MHHTTARTLSNKERYESHLISLYGPRPINVFKQLREHLDLSHAELATRMYTSKQSLIRLEQGCYAEPLPTAMDWWIKNYGDVLKSDGIGVTHLSLTDRYEDFQESMRLRHRQFFGPHLKVPTSEHPLKQLRSRCYNSEGASITEVAKALCLHQATLQYWESKWKQQQSVPKPVTTVLLNTGYTRDDVANLCNDYELWRNYKLGRVAFYGT